MRRAGTISSASGQRSAARGLPIACWSSGAFDTAGGGERQDAALSSGTRQAGRTAPTVASPMQCESRRASEWRRDEPNADEGEGVSVRMNPKPMFGAQLVLEPRCVVSHRQYEHARASVYMPARMKMCAGALGSKQEKLHETQSGRRSPCVSSLPLLIAASIPCRATTRSRYTDLVVPTLLSRNDDPKITQLS